MIFCITRPGATIYGITTLFRCCSVLLSPVPLSCISLSSDSLSPVPLFLRSALSCSPGPFSSVACSPVPPLPCLLLPCRMCPCAVFPSNSLFPCPSYPCPVFPCLLLPYFLFSCFPFASFTCPLCRQFPCSLSYPPLSSIPPFVGPIFC